MRWQLPRSTTDQEAWDLTAFILERNHLIPAGSSIDARILPLVKMPNRDGFIPAFPKLLPAMGGQGIRESR
jgi:cytochrome c